MMRPIRAHCKLKCSVSDIQNFAAVARHGGGGRRTKDFSFIFLCSTRSFLKLSDGHTRAPPLLRNARQHSRKQEEIVSMLNCCHSACFWYKLRIFSQFQMTNDDTFRNKFAYCVNVSTFFLLLRCFHRFPIGMEHIVMSSDLLFLLSLLLSKNLFLPFF